MAPGPAGRRAGGAGDGPVLPLDPVTALADGAGVRRDVLPTGANIVGQRREDQLHSPPPADEALRPDTILVAAGHHAAIRRLAELARPITDEGALVVVGFGEVGQKLAEFLTEAGEEVCVIADAEGPGVDPRSPRRAP